MYKIIRLLHYVYDYPDDGVHLDIIWIVRSHSHIKPDAVHRDRTPDGPGVARGLHCGLRVPSGPRPTHRGRRRRWLPAAPMSVTVGCPAELEIAGNHARTRDRLPLRSSPSRRPRAYSCDSPTRAHSTDWYPGRARDERAQSTTRARGKPGTMHTPPARITYRIRPRAHNCRAQLAAPCAPILSAAARRDSRATAAPLLEDGRCQLRQGCLGAGGTRRDASARRQRATQAL
jgi:hypothetical protein